MILPEVSDTWKALSGLIRKAKALGKITNDKITVYLLDIAMAATNGKKFFVDIFVQVLRQLLLSLSWV